jgi:hypothetical protein
MKNRKRESCTSGSVRDEGGNILIYSAIPNSVICPIEDADEIFCATLKQPFEPAAIFGSEDLPPICGADGRQSIAVADAGFEERDLAIELDPVRSE